jgi:hypothetical protein
MTGLSVDELQCLGYLVEDLGDSPGLEGKFRWTNAHTNESQNVELASSSQDEAWGAAAAAWGDKHDLDVVLVTTTTNLMAAQLDGYYNPGGVNGSGEHPTFTRADWRRVVGDGATVTGYWVWLASEISQQARQAEYVGLCLGERHKDWLNVGH